MIQNKRGKKAQMTIWIIIAIIVITFSLIVLFVFNPFKISFNKQTTMQKPDVFISDCMKDFIIETADIISVKGGYYEDPNIYIGYDGQKVGYLCYTNIPFTNCSNQQPFLTYFVEQQIKEQTIQSDIINRCLTNYKQDLIKKGYSVETCEKINSNKFNVTFGEQKIILPIDCFVHIKKEDKNYNFDKINVEIEHPLPEFVEMAKKIIETEIETGDFPLILVQTYNPSLEIKIERGESRVYILQKINTDKKFVFGIKNQYRERLL
jgi:hypothetical protein